MPSPVVLFVFPSEAAHGHPTWEDFFGQFHCQTPQGTSQPPKGDTRHSKSPALPESDSLASLAPLSGDLPQSSPCLLQKVT